MGEQEAGSRKREGMYVRQDGVRFNWELLLEAIAGTGRLRRADEPSGTRGNCNSPKRGEYSCRQSPSERLEQLTDH